MASLRLPQKRGWGNLSVPYQASASSLRPRGAVCQRAWSSPFFPCPVPQEVPRTSRSLVRPRLLTRVSALPWGGPSDHTWKVSSELALRYQPRSKHWRVWTREDEASVGESDPQRLKPYGCVIDAPLPGKIRTCTAHTDTRLYAVYWRRSRPWPGATMGWCDCAFLLPLAEGEAATARAPKRA
jgi:hypothetical protein